MSEPWHSEEPGEVLRALGSSREGLTSVEARARLAKYGRNELVASRRRSPLAMFLGEFRDVFILLLIAATVLSALLGEVGDATVIGAIVVLVAVTGFVQEFRAERAIEAMKRLGAPKARVIRDGSEQTIPAREVVPGDVLALESGDYVPADARLLEAVELMTDEAILTGESSPVSKSLGPLPRDAAVSERGDMVFTATHVTYGRGRAVVTSTGMGTEFGKIAEVVQSEREGPPPLQKKLNQFAMKIAKVVVAVVLVIFSLEAFEVVAQGRFAAAAFSDVILSSISLAISAVPEGLPAIVTVALALGAREFARRNVVVRRLSSAESMGAVTVICADKTGTITRGEMTVRELCFAGGTAEVTGVGYGPEGEVRLAEGSGGMDGALLLLKIGALCNNARLLDGGGARISGDPTEGALLVAAAKAGLKSESLDREYHRRREVPFTSERKFMATLHSTEGSELMVCVKGAPETVLDRCSKVMASGRAVPMTPAKREEILGANRRMAGKALRVLAMAYKSLPGDAEAEAEALEGELVFAGLQGMSDPPREEAIRANQRCRKAGIRTVMITGDQELTAMAVAKEVGIMTEGSVSLTGRQLDALGDAAFGELVEKTAVYSRVAPEHKLRIVRAWQGRGQIVAMTGDGVNDAPALKAADVGIAMGVTGTDVSKEASDLVLADDNFATIVKAVEQGRVIYDNIRKYVRFLIAGNFDELVVIGTFALLGGVFGPELFPLPLTAAMILWINLITDGPPAVALATDPPDIDVMDRPPRRPSDGILHGMGRFVVMSFAMQAAGTMLVFCLEYYVWPSGGFGTEQALREARTAAFTQAVLFELLVVWNCRSEKRSVWRMGRTALRNRLFIAAELVSVVASVGIVYLPITQHLFSLSPLGLRSLAVVMGVSSLGLLILPEFAMNRRFWKWE